MKLALSEVEQIKKERILMLGEVGTGGIIGDSAYVLMYTGYIGSFFLILW